MSPAEIEALALSEDRRWQRLALAGHVFAFVAINALLIAFWAAAGGGSFWPGRALVAWGLPLVYDVWRTVSPERKLRALAARPRPGGRAFFPPRLQPPEAPSASRSRCTGSRAPSRHSRRQLIHAPWSGRCPSSGPR
jgi:hypothetical protein